jgi:hypothetical protein
VQPGDADARPHGRRGHPFAVRFHTPDDLMAGDEIRLPGGKIALHDVEVGVADTADFDADQDLALTRLRTRPGDLAEGMVLHGSGTRQEHRVHSVPSYSGLSCCRRSHGGLSCRGSPGT